MLTVLIALGACSVHTEERAGGTDAIATAAVMRHVHALTRNIGARRASSKRAREAALYIDRELSSMGLRVTRRPLGTVDLPAIAVGPLRFFSARRRTFSDDNLWVEVHPDGPAARKTLLVMAHYDTVSRSPGAADNAVAVGIALELARTLSVRAPARPVIIAFTAAEEYRLAGARALARELRRDGERDIGLAVSLDLLGGPGTLTVNGASELIGSDWLRYLAGAAERAAVSIEAPVPQRVISRHLPQIERSDHGVFTRAGIPALHFYTRAPGAIYLPYHTHLDTEGRIARSSVRAAARMVESLARSEPAFPRAGGDQGIWLPGTTWTIPGWLLWMLALALIGAIGYALYRLGRARSGASGLGLTSVLGLYALSWLLVELVFWLHSLRFEHPLSWVHNPGLLVPLALVLWFSLFTLLLGALARWRRPVGENRYLMASLASNLLIGVLLLITDTPELACLPLLMAGITSLLAVSKRVPVLLALLLIGAAPLAWPLDPDFLREAVYNGFYRREMPLAAMLSVLLGPTSLAAVYTLRRLPPNPYPAASLYGALALAIAASAIIATHQPACTGALFDAYNLTCELPDIGPTR